MIEIRLFTEQKENADLFGTLERSRLYHFKALPISELKKAHTILKKGSLLYLDTTDLTEKKLLQLINSLAKLTDYSYGIIDPVGAVSDPAKLFHTGASDYIGPNLCKTPISPTRLRDVLDFYAMDHDTEAEEDQEVPFSGKDFSKVINNNTYVFALMYAQLEMPSEVTKKMSEEEKENVDKMFCEYLQETYGPLNGRIWMWSQCSGVLIFPFDGHSCPAVFHAYREMLNSRLTNAERFSVQHPLKMKLALDIGETVYRDRGDTGTLVSDAVNYIHHLGIQYAERSTLYLTQDTVTFLPQGLEDTIIPSGLFKDRMIYRMNTLMDHGA